MRLIDADEFWKDLELAPDDWAKGRTIKAFLDASPTVDAVPVVRCKDCIHRHRGSRAKCTGRRADEFCSDGERRFKDATD